MIWFSPEADAALQKLIADDFFRQAGPIERLAMPPYKKVVSKAQSRKLFALAERGEISEDDARGKTRAANWKSLPERKRSRRSKR